MRTRGDRWPFERILGSMLGSAVGDAFGAPLEHLDLVAIRAAHGAEGLTAPLIRDGRLLAGDETQLMVFTADVLIRAFQDCEAFGSERPRNSGSRAYWRWLATQGLRPVGIPTSCFADGWLLDEPLLRARRQPPLRTLGALSSGRIGTIEAPVNDDAGAGVLGRLGPVGLVLDEPFDPARRLAALTHGNPVATLSAGAYCLILRGIADGEHISDATETTIRFLELKEQESDLARKLGLALDLAASGPSARQRSSRLGTGSAADDALAIGLYCALAAPDGVTALRSAVNRDGPSDSIAAVCGGIVGAAHGATWIPEDWLEHLELDPILRRVIEDLAIRCLDGARLETDRYPLTIEPDGPLGPGQSTDRGWVLG